MKIKKLSERKFYLDVCIRANGEYYRERETFEGTERQARERWHEIRHGLVLRAKADKDADSERVGTFGHILGLYKADRERVGRMQSMRYVFDKLDCECGNYAIKRLPELFAGYIEILNGTICKQSKMKMSNATKNRIISVAKAACRWAYRQDLLEKDYLKSFQLFKETPRNTILNETEITKLRNAFSELFPYLLPAFEFSLYNPIRKGDLINLTKDNLDLFNNLISYTSGKTNTPAAAIIYPHQKEYFASIPSGCNHLFYRPIGFAKHSRTEQRYEPLGDFKKAWAAVKAKAKIDKGLHWHDLRHCAATWLIQQPNIKTYHVQKIGAWRTRVMVERYHSADAMESAIDARDILLKGVSTKVSTFTGQTGTFGDRGKSDQK